MTTNLRSEGPDPAGLVALTKPGWSPNPQGLPGQVDAQHRLVTEKPQRSDPSRPRLQPADLWGFWGSRPCGFGRPDQARLEPEPAGSDRAGRCSASARPIQVTCSLTHACSFSAGIHSRVTRRRAAPLGWQPHPSLQPTPNDGCLRQNFIQCRRVYSAHAIVGMFVFQRTNRGPVVATRNSRLHRPRTAWNCNDPAGA
jgi:hypothetical protein